MNTFEINDIVKHFVGQSNVIAVPAIFKKWLGSYNAAVMFSQIIYWNSRTEDAEGWFYKSYKEWESEIFLTEKEARTTIEYLEKLNLIETKISKVSGNPTKHFKLISATFQDLFVKFLETEKTAQALENKGAEGNLPLVRKETDQTAVSLSSQKLLTNNKEIEIICVREESTESAEVFLPEAKTTAADPQLSPDVLRFPSLAGQKLSVQKLNEIVELFCYVTEQQGRRTLQNDYEWFAMVQQLELEGMSVNGMKSLYRYCKEIEKMTTITPKVMNWKFLAYKEFLQKQKIQRSKPKPQTFDPFNIKLENSALPVGY